MDGWLEPKLAPKQLLLWASCLKLLDLQARPGAVELQEGLKGVSPFLALPEETSAPLSVLTSSLSGPATANIVTTPAPM